MRREPIVLLTSIQHDLQSADAQNQARNSDVVDLYPGLLDAFQISRIFDHAHHEKERQQADWKIDEENPAPGIVVGNPPAESRSNGRRNHSRDAVQCECQTALLRSERVRQDGLRHGL